MAQTCYLGFTESSIIGLWQGPKNDSVKYQVQNNDAMAMKLLFKKSLEWVLLLNKSCFTVTIWTYRIIPKLVKISVHAGENWRSFLHILPRRIFY